VRGLEEAWGELTRAAVPAETAALQAADISRKVAKMHPVPHQETNGCFTTEQCCHIRMSSHTQACLATHRRIQPTYMHVQLTAAHCAAVQG
jgi:hypothetical protein